MIPPVTNEKEGGWAPEKILLFKRVPLPLPKLKSWIVSPVV
jgi:hypothetical protein